MGKVVVTEFVSLDGVMEDPGGAEGFKHGGWTVDFDTGDEGTRFKLDETLEAEALLLGRVTYEGFAAAWPSMEDDVGFADKMNGMPKYVVSSTQRDPEWNNSTVLEGEPADSVAKLKDETEGILLIGGSARLAQGLGAAGLVDEYRLMVFPILLGTGKRLFADADDRTVLELIHHEQVGPDGVVLLTYRPKPE